MLRGSEVEIFDGMTFGDISKKIYTNSMNIRNTIDGLVETLKNQTTSVDATVMTVPVIKDLLEVSVRNDEQLTKLIGTVQRLIIAELHGNSTDPTELLSDHEKDQLLRNAETTRLLVEEVEAIVVDNIK